MQNLYNARKSRGLSREKLADMVGLNPYTIRDYEQFRYQPSPETLQLLSNALNYPPEYLTGQTEKENTEGKLMESTQEVERMFEAESREKKKIATGAFHMASRRKGFHGSMMLYADTLTKEQRKEYTKASEVKLSNEVDAIVPLEEFKDYPMAKKRAVMAHWLSKYPRETIAAVWGNAHRVNGYVRRLGLAIRRSDDDPQEQQHLVIENPIPVYEYIPAVAAADPIPGISLSYNTVVNAEEAKAIFEGLCRFLSRSNNYEINLILEEQV